MRILKISINNFRGVSVGEIKFTNHNVLIGDNNAGKSTILEAIDLVLGPDRLNKLPVIDEHDFYNSIYLDGHGNNVPIRIIVTVTDLVPEQRRRFLNHIEFWDKNTDSLIESPPANAVDSENVLEVLRLGFKGEYDKDEDDFRAETYFCSPEMEDGIATPFSKRDKRECGFLYLRAIRTGSRALSLERGSLLDIILRIKEVRPQMWENVIKQLKSIPIASEDKSGLSEILTNVQEALREFVPNDWGAEPHLKISDLTREHLRKTLTVFMSTGSGGVHIPFQHQGMGTINTLVLALLSMIAEQKGTVIFAMEEPEIAIPPYTQKRIVNSIIQKSTQAIFTSHSPYVLEEFEPKQINLVQRGSDGRQTATPVSFPKLIKPKAYKLELRSRFTEALLAKNILITEGTTEALVYSASARHLSELDPEHFASLEELGIAVFDAQSEGNIPIFAEHFKHLGKTLFSVCDKQTAENSAKISSHVLFPFESSYDGIEDLFLEETPEVTLRKHAGNIVAENSWPTHLKHLEPTASSTLPELKKALGEYWTWSKGAGSLATLISECTLAEIPSTIRGQLAEITAINKSF